MRRAAIVGSFVLGLLLPVTIAGAAEVILIQNGTIVTVTGPDIQGGSLLIENGKITKIGKNLSAPAGAKVIDASGKYVYPGMVALMTSVGVTGYPGAGSDTDEVGVSTPHMDPYDAINPEDDCIEVTRVGGVTTVQTVSGSRSVLNGKSVVLHLGGDLAEDLVCKRYAAQIINIAAREQGKYPSTIPGVIALLRDKFDQTKEYAEKKSKQKETAENNGQDEKGGKGAAPPFKHNLELEALIPVVTGQIPVIFITYDELTVRKAIEIIKEYKLKGIIQARAGVFKYMGKLAQEKIPVIWAGTTALPQRWEAYDKNYHTAAALAAHGVLFAFDSGGRGPGNRNVRNLPVPATISVAHGLSEEAAIKALTIIPAKILGIDDEVGSLEEGKVANVVIWTGSPIQLRSRIDTVIIKGELVPMTSLQTRLYDKYSQLVKERMTKK
ncbi:MAG: amidohydrolase family protein [Candidatus Aminicenantaceae bacterium]